MSDAIEAVKRAAYKSKRQRDNWKARYVALEAALLDDGLADKVISGAHESTHEAADPDFCGVCESRRDGVNDYRARLLALIEDKETT